MTLILVILAYVAMGYVTSFVMLLLAYKQNWSDGDKEITSTVLSFFWPLGWMFIVFVVLKMVFGGLYEKMDDTARRFNGRRY